MMYMEKNTGMSIILLIFESYIIFIIYLIRESLL